MDYNFEQYQKDALRTLSNQFHLAVGSPAQDAFHGSIGLVTEAGELMELMEDTESFEMLDKVNLQEEIGDCLWYMAILSNAMCGERFSNDFKGLVKEHYAAIKPNLFTALDCDADELDAQQINYLHNAITSLAISTAELLDIYKKAVFYGKLIDSDDQYERLCNILDALVDMTIIIDVDILQIMHTNIDKLKARFPDKFNSDDANNRDLDKERGILEDGTSVTSGDTAYYNQALDIVRKDKKATISYIQRTLQIGYNRAARLIDMLEANGVISSGDHTGKRTVIEGGKDNDITC